MIKTVFILFALLIRTPEVLHTTELAIPKDEKAFILQAKRTLPYLKEFMELFPAATIEVGWPASIRYTPETEKEVMETVYIFATIGLHYRYMLTMGIPFKLAEDRNSIASFKEPGFRMQEAEEIIVSEGDQAHITFTNFLREFDFERFKVLKEHRGDFSAIGIALLKDKPIKNFERAWKPKQ